MALPVGVAGGLLIFAFEKKLKELRDKGHSSYIVIAAALLIVLSLAIVNSRLVDFVIPIPVPSIQVPVTPVSARQALVQASMLGSLVVLFPLFLVWNYGKVLNEPVFGNLYQQVLLGANGVLVLTKTPLFIGQMNMLPLVALCVLGVTSFCLSIDARRQAQQEFEALQQQNPLPRPGLFRRAARGLAFTIMWTAAIVEAWA